MTHAEKRHVAACLREDARRHDQAAIRAGRLGIPERRIARHAAEAAESRRLSKLVLSP